jgi:serine/threonine protein kinase
MSTFYRHIDKYELHERLGHGGMGEVWKALDTQLHRYVAIKVLHANLQDGPNFITRFEREAQLIASLHHPNIITIHDFRVFHPSESADAIAYMVMDYVEGSTLAKILHTTSHEGKFLSPDDLLYLFTPICLAIDYAHQKGVLHRDIKPANILLDQRDAMKGPLGEPILSDFGIAKLLGSSANLHSSGWWLGTPAYTSPEQAMGASGSKRSDIYALSVILYEACTGTLPFQGENPAAIIMQHIHKSPVPPALVNPNITPVLAATILRGLAKEPENRFASASALGIAMAEALNMPVPESLRQSPYDMTETDVPTYASSSSSWPPSAPLTPAASSSQAATPSVQGSSNPSLKSAESPVSRPPQTPEPAHSSGGASTPFLPSVAMAEASQQQSASTFLLPKTKPDPAISEAEKRRKMRLSRVLLAGLLVAASIGAILLLVRSNFSQPTNARPPINTNQVVGHAYFTNSGQLNPDNSQGINDGIVLTLHNIPDPPAGKAYYAWLLGDKVYSEPLTTALGRLTINQGNVSLSYTDTKRHSNLLAYESRLLITEEDGLTTPVSFSPDTKAWAYYAQLSQAASPQDKLHFSMLDHLRHLLSDSPELTVRGLRGGLDMWFLRSTQKILEWANAARDDWRTNPDLLHRQVIRILDYIDGASYVQQDAPAVGGALLVNPHDAQIALLGPQPGEQDPPGYAYNGEVPPGYVYVVSSHLAGAVLSPDATAEQRALAAKIHVEIDTVKTQLERVHQDAKQLVTMNATQQAQSSTLSLLDDMVTQTQYAYTGQPDPQTGEQKGGVIWICNNIQRMAQFDIKLYAVS